MTEQAIITIKGAAARYSVSIQTIRRWIRHGLPYAQPIPGGTVLLRVQDLEAFLQRRTHAGDDLERMVDTTLGELLAEQGRKQ